MGWVRLHRVQLVVQLGREDVVERVLCPVDAEVPVSGTGRGGGILLEDDGGYAFLRGISLCSTYLG